MLPARGGPSWGRAVVVARGLAGADPAAAEAAAAAAGRRIASGRASYRGSPRRRGRPGFASSSSAAADSSHPASSSEAAAALHHQQEEERGGQPGAGHEPAWPRAGSDPGQERQPLPVGFRFATSNRNIVLNSLILSLPAPVPLPSRLGRRSRGPAAARRRGGEPGGRRSSPPRERTAGAAEPRRPAASSPQPSPPAASREASRRGGEPKGRPSLPRGRRPATGAAAPPRRPSSPSPESSPRAAPPPPRRPKHAAAASPAAPETPARIALNDLVRQLGEMQASLDRLGLLPPAAPDREPDAAPAEGEAAARSALARARAWIQDLRSQLVGQAAAAPPPLPPPLPARAARPAETTPKGPAPASTPVPPSVQGALRDLARRLEQMQSQLDRFGPLPPVWVPRRSTAVGHETEGGDGAAAAAAAAAAQSVLVEASAWIRDLQARVVADGGYGGLQQGGRGGGGGGSLSATRHRPELGVLLERIVGVCAGAAALSADRPAAAECSEECRRALRLMASWNMDRQQWHVDCAVVAASCAGRWGEAAELFLDRIDPDRGNPPYDVSVSEPFGLYALAMRQQQTSRSSSPLDSEQPHATPVDRVMDAVQRMSMLSPTDKATHILAAGTALGRAGEWLGLVNYLNDPSKAEHVESLGQPLVAATMHACILCDQHDEAMAVFDQRVAASDARSAAEWQWGGGEANELYPLCRDLAMRALGGCRNKPRRDPTSGVGVGADADEGFSARALECYWSAFDDGVTVSLEAVCGVAAACEADGRWEDAVSVLFSLLTKSLQVRWIVPGNELSIGSVVEGLDFHPDVAARMGEFASIVLRACNTSRQPATAILAFWLLTQSLTRDVHPNGILMSPSELSEAFAPVFSVLHKDKDPLLAALMTSLRGLSCPQQSIKLYESVAGRCTTDEFVESNRVLETVLHRKNEVTTSDFLSVLTRMHRFMIAFQVVCVDNGENSTDGEARLMSAALASIITSFNNASQPQAGVQLATWVDLHTSSSEPYLPATDSLVAALIDAHSACGNYDAALDILHKQQSRLGTRHTGVLTSIAAIKLLFRVSRVTEALALFDAVAEERQSPDLFSAVASGLVHVGDWYAVTDVYRRAVTKGHLSEELGLLTMKSVSEMRLEGRYRTMRNIAEDVANVIGLTPREWIESKYWNLKRLVGFPEAARLMWWGDPDTRRLDELNFALQSIEKRKLEGHTPKSAALRLVVSAAKSFRMFELKQGKEGFHLLPEDVTGWIQILKAVAVEAQQSPLIYDAGFVESIALSFVELGSFEDATRILDEAKDRGLDLQRSVLYTGGSSGL